MLPTRFTTTILMNTSFCSHLLAPKPRCTSLLINSQSYAKSAKINLKDKSSRQWLVRQMNDKYVKLARIENWRCRSAFKLLEIQEKYEILKPGMRVIDCGAAPGSWSQVAAKLVQSTGAEGSPDTGFVLSLDRDFFQPVEGCTCVRNADFTSDITRHKLLLVLDKKKVDVLLSDMAPNASGHREMDHDSIISLNTELLDFSQKVLKDGGTMVCKLWEGGRTRHFLSMVETVFSNVKLVKPESSRTHSAEIFVLARGYENPRTDN